MRIPAEAMALYLTESSPTPVADQHRAEPVDNAPRLGNSLPEPDPDFAAIAGEIRRRKNDAPPSRKYQPERRHSTHARHPYVGDDRRKTERRTQNLPVMLDTRTILCRRRETWALRIDFSI